MSDENTQQRAIEELAQLGLREYEAKCFVSLVKITSGTAREVSEHIDVPRTRVYEAVRSLESDGLVEIQHSSPQQFRAVPLGEAIEVLEQRHQSRINRLERVLTEIRQESAVETQRADPEVWSLAGRETVAARTKRLIDDADSEVLLLVGDRDVVRNGVGDCLHSATDRGVDVVIGAGSESMRSRLADLTDELAIFESDLGWLSDTTRPSGISVGGLLLVDERALLASTVIRNDGEIRERAVCGNGSANSLVLVLRGFLSEYLENAPNA